MKGSLTIGNFWGTEIRLHWSLLLLIPYMLLAFRPASFADALRVFLLIVAVFACVTLHEAGHTLAARSFGIEVNSITLWPLGGFANLKRRPEKTWQNLVVVAAGPFTNLLLTVVFGVLALFERLLLDSLALPGVSLFFYRINAFPVLMGLVIANLSLLVFNLVPIYPLDGGQIARDLLKLLFGEKRADQLMVFISLPLALLVFLIGLVTFDVALLLTGVLLLLATLSLSSRAAQGMAQGAMYFVDRGSYYLRNGDYYRAVEELTRAIQKQPNKPGPLVNRALAYLSMEELELARADLDRALAIDPQHPLALNLLGELQELQGDPQAALENYSRSIALRPNWAIAYADRGMLRQKMGDSDGALQDLNQAIAVTPNSAITYLLRSILRFEIGDHDGAAQDEERALRFAPGWMLVFPEAFLQNLKGRLDWVMDYYNRAIERYPGAYQGYQGRADALRANDRLYWALADYDRALALAPKQAEIYYGRGETFRCLSMFDKAAENYRLADQCAEKEHVRQQARRRLAQIMA